MTAPPRKDAPQPLFTDRLGIDVEAGRRFGSEQTMRLERMAAVLTCEQGVSEAQVTDAFAAFRLGADAVIVLEPAAPGVQSLFVEGGVAVRYNGTLSPDLRRCLKTIHGHLKLLPGHAYGSPPPPASGPAAHPGGDDERPTRRPTDPSLPLPLLAPNGALRVLPHDPAARRLAERLWRPCPTIDLGDEGGGSCGCEGSGAPEIAPDASLCALVDALRGVGALGLGYKGGEPTRHPAFLGLVRYAASQGFETQVLVSDGVRLADAAFAARVVAAGIDVVVLSLDTFDPDVHASLPGEHAPHARVVAGLHTLLATPGVEVVLSAVVTPPTASLLPSYLNAVAHLQRQYGKPIGVLLAPLLQTTAAGSAPPATPLGLPEATRVLGDALAAATTLGVTALTFGVPPCLLPGHEQYVAELYAAHWAIDLASGAAVRAQRRGGVTYWTVCGTCPHITYCPGVPSPCADDVVQALVAASEPATTAARRLHPATRGERKQP